MTPGEKIESVLSHATPVSQATVVPKTCKRVSSLQSLVISSHFVLELSNQYLKTATRNMISSRRTSDTTHNHL